MERYFYSIKVNLLNQKYENENISSDKTAEIVFLSKTGETVDRASLAFIEPERIYSQIDKKEKLNFQGCYIPDFSLNDYRKSRKKEVNEEVSLFWPNFENTIFGISNETSDTINFNFAKFSGNANYKNVVFTGAKVLSFESCNFEDEVSFDYALFNFMDVSFSDSEFKGQTLSFKNGIFKTGLKRFENIQYKCNEISFLNTEFGEGDVIFSNSEFGDANVWFKVARFGQGRIDFNKVHFGKGILSFEKAEFGDGNVNFRSSNFDSGDVEFTRCVFGEGDISFIAANFYKGNVSFAGTEFGAGKLSFKQAFFGGDKVDFHYAHFGVGDVIFERTDFKEGNVDFRAVDFGIGKITFNRAYFGSGEVIFEASELKNGRITFRKTMCNSGVFNFEMADFKNAELVIDDVNFGQGKVSFRQSKFGLLSLESSQINNYFDLRVEECGKLDLSNSIIKDLIDLDAPEFKSNIKSLDLSGIRLLGRIFIDWRQNDVKKLIHQQKTSFANKAAQFRVLKENYNALGQYDYEDEAYVEFKRCESKSILEQAKKNKLPYKIMGWLRYFFQDLLFDKVGLYATNPVRVLFSMIVAYVIFSLIYVVLPYITNDSGIYSSLFPIGDPRDLTIVQRAFYHSAVTSLTIGYGDYYPSGHIRWLSGLQGFLGVFLMSYFTVAFVRKILR
ncbi:MAG: potassium channel family protein [Bacteroidales bacterium]